MPAASRLILASASPRRRELLRATGIPFRVIPARIDEVPLPGEAPRRFARRAAREKGMEVGGRHPGSFVLSADTVVVVGGTLLGKPLDPRDGIRMLSLLAGREHLVHTAVFLSRAAGGYRDEAVATTRVRFRSLSAAEIAGYIRTKEGDDKAGAYAAQGAGNLLIERIVGSYTNVVGLPMTLVLAMLSRAGLVAVSRRGPGWYVPAGGAG